MRRLQAILVLGLFVLAVPAGRAADAPWAGNWKLTVLPRGPEMTLWLVRVMERDGKPHAYLLSAGPAEFRNTHVKVLSADKKAVRLQLEANGITYTVVGYLPSGEAVPKQLLGSNEALGRRDLLRWERTTDNELPAEPATQITSPASEAFEKAFVTSDAKEREAAFKNIVERFAGQPVAFHAAMQLVNHAVEQGGTAAEAKRQAEQALKLAASYGREMELHAAAQIAQQFSKSDRLSDIALEAARKAQELLHADDPPAVQARVVKALASAYRKADQPGLAAGAESRLARLNDQLDQTYLKSAIPFELERFAGRRKDSKRAILVELFTGAQCPPCVAADVAFDALRKAYRPAEVVLLQYHLHIPGPDALTNADSEKRAEFYQVAGTPYLIVNGQDGPPVFGYRQHAKERYNALRRAIDPKLDTESQATLQVTASRNDNLLDIEATYNDVKKVGDDIRLRFALVEEAVRYPSTNGQRFHHHVVRAFPGGVKGFAIKNAKGNQSLTADIEQVRVGLARYLNEFAKTARLPDDERPLDLKGLKLAAFIQDDTTKDVLQAVQVDIPTR